MVEAVLLDQNRVMACSAYLNGEFGLSNLYVGVPVKLGAGGVKSIYDIELSDDERAALQHSAGAVTELVEAMERLQQES
jgi:malate dehydrogenase